ncbi:hypothetical protein [Microbulbifer sp. ALW1]|uniref:hypothetical protein n=1 Tax=Microbulbifer sp. (strain ALW1) TaxID=1516059 RepID=UPI001358EFB6|nr:hypothetical protein [Microbulbifer sp. ALW1]
MPILLLGSGAYIGPAGQTNEGQMAHSFFGYIKLGNGETIRAHIKIYPSHFQCPQGTGTSLVNRSLENEVIGYSLAEAKGLTVAPRAGLILLTYDQINQPPQWLQPNEAVPAWFSEDAKHPSLANFLKLSELEGERAVAKLKAKLNRSPKKAAAWATFDESVFNVDRNPGNVLTNDTLIDHGSILCSETWSPDQLNAVADQSNSMNKILIFLQEHAAELPFKQERVHAAQSQAASYSSNRDAVHSLLRETLYESQPETAEAVINFIEHRIRSANTPEKVGLVA